MGEVYRARDTSLDRDVAIKILPDAFASHPDRLSRFEREAKTLASLNHPNIAHIYGFEHHGSTRALVLELVEGPTLEDRLRKSEVSSLKAEVGLQPSHSRLQTSGALPVGEALAIARQIAEALEAAHEQGIVHRDLKPANIKVRPDGTVKVLDFGLAKAMEPRVGSAEASPHGLSQSPTVSPGMTEAGMILGTAAYMSPEQARGREADRTSDVWAFGCVLYEMLTGRAVFQGESAGEILAGVFKSEPDWNRLPAATPESIRRLLRRCLQKDRKLRLHDMADARLEIDEASTEPRPSTESPEKIPKRRQRLTWLLMLYALVATVGLAVAVFPRTTALQVMRFSIISDAPAGVGGTTIGGNRALSPDGRKLAFAGRDPDGQSRLFIRDVASLEAHALKGTEDVDWLFWSPDSGSIGFYVLSQRKLKRVNVDGGSLQTIGEIGGVRQGNAPLMGAAWLPDDTIVFADIEPGRNLHRIAASGGAATTILKPDASSGETYLVYPQPAGDGHLLYLARNSNPEKDAVYIAAADGSGKRKVVDSAHTALYASSGHLLYLSNGTVFGQPFDRTSGLAGKPQTLAEKVGGSVWGEINFSISATGLLATWGSSTNNDTRFTWHDPSGKEVGGIRQAGFYRTFDLSPDGKRVAVHIHDGRTTAGNLWIVDVARDVIQRFTQTENHDTTPLWSPDGSRIAFVSSDRDSIGVYVKEALSSGSPRLLQTLKSGITLRGWSRDGRFMLYEENENVFAAPLSDFAARIAVADSSFSERWPDFSPDGRWVAYTSEETGRREVYVQSFPDPRIRVRVTTDGGSEPRWNHDGKELFFISNARILHRIPINLGAPPAIGTAVSLFPIDASSGVDGSNHYQVARDDRILTNSSQTRRDETETIVTVNWPSLLNGK